MATASQPQSATGVADIDSMLSGLKWNSQVVTYNFPADASYYGASYGGQNEPGAFAPVSASFQSMVRNALAQYSAAANLTFTEVGPGDLANTSVARTLNMGTDEANVPASGRGYLPGIAIRGGDAWFRNSTEAIGDSEVRGRSTWRFVMHEIGHTLGFVHHPDDDDGLANGPMSAEHAFNDYTLMSYRTRQGASIADVNRDRFGAPQTLMMYDIAAIQAMYGANFGTNAGDSIYSWNPATGGMSINGSAQPVPGANVIYGTVWDGGGVDTYDLSNYGSGLSLDLRPGGRSTFSQAQLALVDVPSGTRATGNIFNALLFGGDARSMIENARGGSGHDLIQGNEAGNLIFGGGGADTVSGFGGDDRLYGNLGTDLISGNQGGDQLFGGQEADRIFGGQGADSLFGNLGDDLVYGNLGEDTMSGGQGNDTLYGGQGSDTINGNLGDDVLFGNLGADRLAFGQGSGNDRVGGFNVGEGDRLDLQGQAYSVSAGADGAALLTLSGGGTVTLTGIAPEAVNASFFI